MALLAAVEAFLLGRDHEAEWRMWEGYLETIRQAVADLPSVDAEQEMPGTANVTPYLNITWDPAVLQRTAQDVHAELLDGDPRILVNLRGDGLMINPYVREDGEDAVVARRLRQVLSTPAPSQEEAPALPPAADISGDWRIRMRFVYGESVNSLHAEQQDAQVQGTYRTQYDQVPLTGQVAGSQVTLRGRYQLTGAVDGDQMQGTANVGQEWPATWSATRTRE